MQKYQTQSLYEASYLLAKGFMIVSKDFEGHKVTLTFQSTPELQAAVLNFYNGTGGVSAKAFVDNYRSLKDMVFQR